MHDLKANRMTLEIPARSVYVGVVRLALAALARQAGLDEDRVEDLRMAVSEACANAVLSDDGSPSSSIAVSWREEVERVVVEVIDRSASAAPGSKDDSAGADRLEMSLALMRSLVDECTFERHGGGGLTTRLELAL